MLEEKHSRVVAQQLRQSLAKSGAALARIVREVAGRVLRFLRQIFVFAVLVVSAAYALYLFDYSLSGEQQFLSRVPLVVYGYEIPPLPAEFVPSPVAFRSLYGLLPDLIGGVFILLLGQLLLYAYKLRRKQSLRNTAYQNGVPLLVLLRQIETHYKTKSFSEFDTVQRGRDHYVAFIRTFLWANLRAKRAIDLNDTISADTFLRLERYEFDAVQDNTRAAYELTSSFEYVTERLSSRDLFRPGYEDVDLVTAEQILTSLISDVLDSRIQEDLSRFQSTFVQMLQKLGARRKPLDKLEQDIETFQKRMWHAGPRVPSAPPVTRKVAA